MGDIKLLLDRSYGITEKINPAYEYFRTLFAVHLELRSNSIRLDYKYMNISGYLKLLQAVKEQLFNKRVDTYNIRLTVAEEMSKLKLYPQMITEDWERHDFKPPNRAFLDVLYKVDPSLAKYDLLRREYSKLNQAWKRGDEKEQEAIREKIEELKRS